MFNNNHHSQMQQSGFDLQRLCFFRAVGTSSIAEQMMYQLPATAFSKKISSERKIKKMGNLLKLQSYKYTVSCDDLY
jgi:hypothetical protein